MNSKEIVTLIELVEENRCIYDRAHPLHNNQNHIKDVWQRIAEELNQPVKKVRDKWKNLRDSYRSQLYRKQDICDTGDVPVCESAWPYFQQMSFLHDHMLVRKSSSLSKLKRDREDDSNEDTSFNITRFAQPINNIEMVTVEDIDMEHFNYHDPEIMVKKSKLDGRSSKMTELEEDKSFFDSLLPYMKRLSPRDKMLCRMRIQEVIFSIAFPKEEEPEDSTC